MWIYLLCSLVGVLGLSFQDHVPASDKGIHVVKEANERIKGGEPAKLIIYPYIVQYVVNKKRFCAGSIVSKRNILTAANCVDNATPDMIVLRAGKDRRGKGTTIPIAKILLHPDYNGDFERDIAILTTRDKIDYMGFIVPARIPHEGQDTPKSIAVAGWGEEEDGSGLSPELIEVDLRVISNEECKSYFEDLVSEDTFCTDYKRDREGPCEGDQGGPAVKNGVLYGIVSVPGFCRESILIPTLYTALAGPSIHRFVTENSNAQEVMD